MRQSPYLFLALLILSACSSATQPTVPPHATEPAQTTAIAAFAGGCFWCTEAAFEHYEPYVNVTSGYTGGTTPNPNYDTVSAGETDHYEAVEVRYDPRKISYDDLLEIYWREIDPTDATGSFVDRGLQYRSAIFTYTPEQQAAAVASRDRLAASGRINGTIVTEILPASTFYNAEAYHQDYHKKNPIRYNYYRSRSGRDQYRDAVWGDAKDYVLATTDTFVMPSQEELKKRLTPIQYSVTQEDDTEPPFDNEYWDEKRDGIYVDIVSGEALFSSKDKYDSGTGWPSFTKPLEPDNIILKDDWGFLGKRTEVRSKKGNSHLGHVFDDGPAPTGKRYCMNSAALRFIPKEDLVKEGYGKYVKEFE